MGKIKLWFRQKIEKFKSWWLIFQIEVLKTKYYGRQTQKPEKTKSDNRVGDVAVKTKQKVTIHAKIIRANGAIEDLGIIARSDE